MRTSFRKLWAREASSRSILENILMAIWRYGAHSGTLPSLMGVTPAKGGGGGGGGADDRLS